MSVLNGGNCVGSAVRTTAANEVMNSLDSLVSLAEDVSNKMQCKLSSIATSQPPQCEAGSINKITAIMPPFFDQQMNMINRVRYMLNELDDLCNRVDM